MPNTKSRTHSQFMQDTFCKAAAHSFRTKVNLQLTIQLRTAKEEEEEEQETFLRICTIVQTHTGFPPRTHGQNCQRRRRRRRGGRSPTTCRRRRRRRQLLLTEREEEEEEEELSFPFLSYGGK